MTERIRVTNCAETCSISDVERMCSTALIVSSPSSSSCTTDWHPGTTNPHSNALICAHPRQNSAACRPWQVDEDRHDRVRFSQHRQSELGRTAMTISIPLTLNSSRLGQL